MRDKFGRFIKGHVPIKQASYPTGDKSIFWKGGTFVDNGYVYIYSPNHPHAVRKYVREHRLVMEKNLGRYLKPTEIVHHINQIRHDNRIENLKLYKNNSSHHRGHGPKRPDITVDLVMNLRKQGYFILEISKQLNASPRTIKKRINSYKNKIGFTSRMTVKSFTK